MQVVQLDKESGSKMYGITIQSPPKESIQLLGRQVLKSHGDERRNRGAPSKGFRWQMNAERIVSTMSQNIGSGLANDPAGYP